VFFIYNLFFFFTLIKQTPQLGNEQIRYEINHFLSNKEIANDYIYVVVDWGMYYFQSLFGDINQTVLYEEPFSEIYQVEDLEIIRSQTHNNFLFIYNKNVGATVTEFIKANYDVVECLPFKNSGSWGILYENKKLKDFCK